MKYKCTYYTTKCTKFNYSCSGTFDGVRDDIIWARCTHNDSIRIPLMEEFKFDMTKSISEKKSLMNLKFKIKRQLKFISLNREIMKKLFAKILIGFYILLGAGVLIKACISIPLIGMLTLITLGVVGFVLSIGWAIVTLGG